MIIMMIIMIIMVIMIMILILIMIMMILLNTNYVKERDISVISTFRFGVCL